MSHLRILNSLFLLLFMWSVEIQAASNVIPSAAVRPKILILNSYQPGLPIPDSINRGIFAALREGGFSARDVFVEHLDFARTPSSEHRTNLINLLHRKLALSQIDVVIAIGAPATDFMAREGLTLFPDSTVLALISPNYEILGRSYDRVMNVPWKVDPAGTLRSALAMFPETRQVFVVTGANDAILPFLDQAKKAFTPWQGKLHIEYSNQMTYEQMLQRLSNLPPDTLVIYSPFFNDTTGRAFVPAEVVGKVCQVASVPVFATLEEYLGRGIIGGSLLRTEDIGKKAGNLTLAYLNKQLTLDKSITTFETATLSEFDWRELKRWDVNNSHLPEKSLVINRPPTLWGQYKVAVIIANIAILLMLFISIGLIILNRRLKRISIKAHDSEERFRVMMEYAPEAVVIYDVDLRQLIDANIKAEQLVNCSREKILQDGPEKFYSPHQPDNQSMAESMADNTKRALAGEEAIFERTVRSDDDRDIACEVRLVRLPYNGQRLLRASFIDISARKQAEMVRSATSERFTVIMDSLDALVYVADMESYELLFVNEFGRKLFGDIEGKVCWQSLQTNQSGPCSFCSNHRLIENGRPTAVYVWEFQNTLTGNWFQCRDKAIRWNDNRLVRMEIATDITERKQSENALKEAKAFTESALNSIPDIFFAFDLNGTFLGWNKTLSELSGYSDEELIRMKPNQFFSGEDIQRVGTAIERVYSEGSAKIEAHLVLKNGHHIPCEFSSSVLKGNNGQVIGFTGTGRDITERKLAEDEKLLLESQIMHAQKIDSIGQLAGGVAHDFNNMLSVILGHAELALMKAMPSSPSSSNLEEICKAANRSADLTRQLLTFARKQTVVPKVLDLNATVAAMLNMLQRLIGENIHLSWNPAPNLWPVKIDPSQMDQILANLCVNSRDAIAGIGNISIETGERTFDENYRQSHLDIITDDYVRLTVSDNGCGIGSETLAKIFEPFFTTKEIGCGTGLGLATVYGAVKQNNGFIDVLSTPGKGTTFNIYLPRVQAEVEFAEQSDLTQLRQGTETVLLAEDDKMLLKLIKAMLEESGYTVLIAATPDLAHSLAREHSGKIDLLISDVIMPGMNGKELSEKIKILCPEIKTLFMSGYTADIISSQGVIEGGLQFIQKPISFEALTTKVREVLGSH